MCHPRSCHLSLHWLLVQPVKRFLKDLTYFFEWQQLYVIRVVHHQLIVLQLPFDLQVQVVRFTPLPVVEKLLSSGMSSEVLGKYASVFSAFTA